MSASHSGRSVISSLPAAFRRRPWRCEKSGIPARRPCASRRRSMLAKKLIRSGRRRAGDRGHGGRRPHRTGHDLRAGPGNPAESVTEVPIFVAGGIGRGEAIVSYLEMGAAGVQLGTRFVCATESIAHPRISRQAFIRAEARDDAVLSLQVDPRFPVIPVRAIANPGTRRFGEIQRELIAKVDQGHAWTRRRRNSKSSISGPALFGGP